MKKVATQLWGNIKYTNFKPQEVITLLCLYIVALTHYDDSFIAISLYLVLPFAFIINVNYKHIFNNNKHLKRLCILYLWIVFCSLFAENIVLVGIEIKKILGCFFSCYVISKQASDQKRIYFLYFIYILFLVSTWDYALTHLWDIRDYGDAQLSDDTNKLNANTFAYFTTYATFIIYVLGEIKNKFGKFLKILFPLTLVLSFLTAIVSSSRQLLIIQVPLIVLLLINRYQIKKGKNIFVLLFLVGASIFLFDSIGQRFYDNSYLSRRAENSVMEDTRILIAKEAFNIGLENPFVGVGPGNVSSNISTGNFSHNTFLELFAGTGIIGCILFCILLGTFVKKQYDRYRMTHDRFFMAFLIFGIIWTFDQLFYVFHDGLWLISFFILVCTHSDVYYNENYIKLYKK